MQELTDLDKLIPNHPCRIRVYEKFNNLITNYINNNYFKDIEFNYDENSIKKLAINLERGIFNYAISFYVTKSFNETWNDQFKWFYINRSVQIYNNLNPNGTIKNNTLLYRLLIKEFNEFEVCTFKPEQLFPERWKELMDTHCKDLNLPQQIKLEDRPDGILKCGRCKSYKTEYSERQTRSADEPTTKFCYCHNCGNRWRFC